MLSKRINGKKRKEAWRRGGRGLCYLFVRKRSRLLITAAPVPDVGSHPEGRGSDTFSSSEPLDLRYPPG